MKIHALHTRYHICGVMNRACSSRLTHLRMTLQAESAAARLARGERATYSSTSLSPHAVVVQWRPAQACILYVSLFQLQMNTSTLTHGNAHTSLALFYTNRHTDTHRHTPVNPRQHRVAICGNDEQPLRSLRVMKPKCKPLVLPQQPPHRLGIYTDANRNANTPYIFSPQPLVPLRTSAPASPV